MRLLPQKFMKLKKYNFSFFSVTISSFSMLLKIFKKILFLAKSLLYKLHYLKSYQIMRVKIIKGSE